MLVVQWCDGFADSDGLTFSGGIDQREASSCVRHVLLGLLGTNQAALDRGGAGARGLVGKSAPFVKEWHALNSSCQVTN